MILDDLLAKSLKNQPTILLLRREKEVSADVKCKHCADRVNRNVHIAGLHIFLLEKCNFYKMPNKSKI